MDEAEIQALIRQETNQAGRKWVLRWTVGGTFGGVFLGFFLGWLWGDIVRPSVIEQYRKQVQEAADAAQTASREAKEALARIKADALIAGNTLEIFKSDEMIRRIADSLASHDQIKAKFAALTRGVEDNRERIERLKYERGIDSRMGALGLKSGTERQVHRFEFAVKNAWIENPFSDCVKSIRIMETRDNQVTVEIEYPEKGCNRFAHYIVWATSIGQPVDLLAPAKPR